MTERIPASRLKETMLRGLAVWLVIILAESFHGTLRELFLKPLLGDVRARQISFFIALVIIFAITLLFIRWVRASNTKQLLLIGVMWVGLTICFEAVVGRIFMGISWERFAADYDPSQGGLMLFGMVFLFLTPVFADRLRRTFRPAVPVR